jgi:hypothetical protein
MKPQRIFGVLAFAATAWAAGCSGGSRYGEVRGDVTLDGKPLDEGVVRFVPLDGKTPTASALITNGKFSERVPVANHRVEISSPKLPKGIRSSGQMKRGTVDEGSALEELIPERYNTRSELKAEVHRGTNEVRFDLKSK